MDESSLVASSNNNNGGADGHIIACGNSNSGGANVVQKKATVPTTTTTEVPMIESSLVATAAEVQMQPIEPITATEVPILPTRSEMPMDK